MAYETTCADCGLAIGHKWECRYNPWSHPCGNCSPFCDHPKPATTEPPEWNMPDELVGQVVKPGETVVVGRVNPGLTILNGRWDCWEPDSPDAIDAPEVARAMQAPVTFTARMGGR